MSTQPHAAAPTPHQYSPLRWGLCGLLFAATAINYMDRSVLGILAHTLQADLHWTESSYSNIVVAFTFAYGLGYIFAGLFIDRVGAKLGYAASVLFWTLSALAHGAVTTVAGFGSVRFLLGLGESGNFPAAIRAVSECFPAEERALAVGLFNSGSNASALVAPFFIAAILHRTGSWRAAFAGVGCLGLLWLAGWMLFPYKRAAVNAQPQGSPQANPQAHSRDWRALLRTRNMWAFVLAKALTDPIWWLYLFWLPKFLQDRFSLTVAQIGTPLAIVYCVSSAGAVIGGWASGALIRRGMAPIAARNRVLSVCAVIALAAVFVTHLTSLAGVVALFALLTAMHQAWAANLFAANADVFPADVLSLAVGIAGAAGAFGGVLFQKATGFVLEAGHGNYAPVFLAAGFAYLLAYFAFQRFTRPVESAGSETSRQAGQ